MRGLYCLLLILCLASAGCSSGPGTAGGEFDAYAKTLKKQVKKQVKDKTRRARLMLLIDEGNQILMDLNIALIDFSADVRSNPQMDREEYEKFQAEFRSKRVEALRALAETRLKMRTYATEDEWNRLFSVKLKSQNAEEFPKPPGSDSKSTEKEAGS
jgi:hypothetical protein